MKKIKLIELTKDAVIIIRITDEMREDYKECARAAAVPGGPGKDCSGCSLDAPPILDSCLAQFSDKEYHQVMDMLEKAEETEEPVKTIRSAAVEELSRYISDLKRDVRDLEWDMLTPEEQEKIRKANKAFMEKHRKAGDRT